MGYKTTATVVVFVFRSFEHSFLSFFDRAREGFGTNTMQLLAALLMDSRQGTAVKEIPTLKIIY